MALDLISAFGNTQWPRQGPPHLRLETISGRNGPCSVSQKSPPESSVPGENLTRGSRRNQLRRGHGSPPVLGEVPHELSTAAHSKECKRSPQQFIPAGFPLTATFNRGRKTQSSPSPHRTWSVPDASSQPQLNLYILTCTLLNIIIIPAISTSYFYYRIEHFGHSLK